MASNELEKFLELSQQADNMIPSAPSRQNSHSGNNQSEMLTENELERFIDRALNPDKAMEGGYNAKREMEELKTVSYNRDSKLPSAILHEMISNPLDMDINAMQNYMERGDGNRMNQLEKKLQEKYGSGLETAQRIQQTMEQRDKQRLTENRITQAQKTQNIPVGGNIDYSLIKTIVESVVEEKLSRLSLLNENATPQPRKLSVIALNEDFTFIDSDGNMYKYDGIKYVGKAKFKTK